MGSTKRTERVIERVRRCFGETLSAEEAARFDENEQRLWGTFILEECRANPCGGIDTARLLAKPKFDSKFFELFLKFGGTARAFANADIDDYVNPMVRPGATVVLPGGGVFTAKPM